MDKFVFECNLHHKKSVESIAYSSNCRDSSVELHWGELFTKAEDSNIYSISIWHEIETPDLIEELVSTQAFPSLSKKCAQQIKL